MLEENKDYELVAVEDHPDAWAIRITSGVFIETVIMFGSIGFNKEQDNISFNFEVLASPDSTLTPANVDLQNYCTMLLESIIMAGMDEGTVEIANKS